MKNIYDWFRCNVFCPLSDWQWSVRIFFENVWVFRRELATFRPFDYSFNLAILKRSLEQTANLLDSDNAYSMSAEGSAEEIRSFLDCLEHFENPTGLAEARLGYRHNWELWLDQMDKARQDPNNKDGEFTRMPMLDKPDRDKRFWEVTNKIEEEMWNKAWEKFSNQARGWWD